MKPESIVLGVAGIFFGLIVGWVIGSQQARPQNLVAAAPAATSQPAQQQAAGPAGQAPKALDEAQVGELRAAAEKSPSDAEPRVKLGNLYFDAERYRDAAQWYEDALKIRPNDADVSTDLAVTYYYLNQPDRALEQFQASLKIDPKHAKTWLNQGIVEAFGKQDLKAAEASWQKLIQVAPGTPEAETARRALEGLKAHPNVQGGPSGAANPGT
jgi:tetratricopeptide (TPR) repeat protein